MAPRPAWKGYLKLSLVSCAVELTGATDHSEKVSFRVINRKTGNTVRRQYIDSVSGNPVEDDDEVKVTRSATMNTSSSRRTRSMPSRSSHRIRLQSSNSSIAQTFPKSISTRPITSRPPTTSRRKPSR